MMANSFPRNIREIFSLLNTAHGTGPCALDTRLSEFRCIKPDMLTASMKTSSPDSSWTMAMSGYDRLVSPSPRTDRCCSAMTDRTRSGGLFTRAGDGGRGEVRVIFYRDVRLLACPQRREARTLRRRWIPRSVAHPDWD